jgi:hypothetical protein
MGQACAGGKEEVLSFRLSAVDRTSPLGSGGAARTAAPRSQEALPSALRMQPPHEEFLTLFSEAGSNIVESAAILNSPAITSTDLETRPGAQRHRCRSTETQSSDGAPFTPGCAP